MSTADLSRLIELVSAGAEAVYRKQHSLAPFWHCVARDGSIHVKQAPAAVMRTFMELQDIVRCCFVSEAWAIKGWGADTVKALDDYLMGGGKLEDHPDRQEILMFIAEDESGIATANRTILREAGSPPRLGALVVNDLTGWTGEGCLVGILPQRGTMQ